MTRTRTWKPIDTATLCYDRYSYRDPIGDLHLFVEPIVIEGLTAEGVRVMVTYRADGDYQDRWVTPQGRPVEITHWRPAR